MSILQEIISNHEENKGHRKKKGTKEITVNTTSFCVICETLCAFMIKMPCGKIQIII